MLMYPNQFNYYPYRDRPTTIRMQQMLQRNHPDYDFSNPEDMRNALKSDIFSVYSLGLLNQDYVDAFLSAFGDRFFMSEIGQETWAEFTFICNGTLRENAQYINDVLDHTDKQFFTAYESEAEDEDFGRQMNETSKSNTKQDGEHYTEINDNVTENDKTKDHRSTRDESLVNDKENSSASGSSEGTTNNKQVTDKDGTVTRNATDKTDGSRNSTGSRDNTGTQKTDTNKSSSEDATETPGVTEIIKNSGNQTNTEGVPAGKLNKTIEEITRPTVTVTRGGTQDTTTNETADQTRTPDVTITDNKNYSSDDADKYSDTPQGMLDQVKNGQYLTNARFINKSGNDNGTRHESGTEQTTGTKNGKTSVEDNRFEKTTYGDGNPYTNTEIHEIDNTNLNKETIREDDLTQTRTQSGTNQKHSGISEDSDTTRTDNLKETTKNDEESSQTVTKTGTDKEKVDQTITDNGGSHDEFSQQGETTASHHTDRSIGEDYDHQAGRTHEGNSDSHTIDEVSGSTDGTKNADENSKRKRTVTRYRLDYDKILDITSFLHKITDPFLDCFLLFY